MHSVVGLFAMKGVCLFLCLSVYPSMWHDLNITWMRPIQQDLESNNLSLNEAIAVAQNRPGLMSTFSDTFLVVLASKEEEEEEVTTIERVLPTACHLTSCSHKF